MSPPPNGHVLVIGGSGMLRWACTRLASQGAIVTVIARDRGSLDALAGEAAGCRGGSVPLSLITEPGAH